MRTLRRVFGSVLLCITITLTAFAVWLLMKGNDPEHAALAGGIFTLALVVPYGLSASWACLRRKPGAKD